MELNLPTPFSSLSGRKHHLLLLGMEEPGERSSTRGSRAQPCREAAAPLPSPPGARVPCACPSLAPSHLPTRSSAPSHPASTPPAIPRAPSPSPRRHLSVPPGALSLRHHAPSQRGHHAPPGRQTRLLSLPLPTICLSSSLRRQRRPRGASGEAAAAPGTRAQD